MTDFAACFDEFRVSAFRLETLRQYAVPAEDERIAAFRERRPLPERSVRTSPWLRRIAETTAAGKHWSRVHVVDVPLSEYVRFEMVTYRESAQAGEDIRITDRRADPALDALQTDFWLFDAETDHPFAALMQYNADGHYVDAAGDERPHRHRRMQGSAGPRAASLRAPDHLSGRQGNRSRMTTGQPREPRIQRARLGSELRRLRTLAGLSGADLGRQLEVSQKTISRIERGDSLPSLPQVTVWARATGAPADRLAVLTGLLEAAVNEVATFRDKLTDGLVAVQLEVHELESSSGTVRNFQTGIIPGLLQTAEYARRVMEMANIRNDANLAAAVAARLERQQALHDKSRHFEFLMTEAALRWRPGPPELLAAQLDHIAALATLDTIELGVIPMDAEMHAITRCSFILYEDRSDGQPPVVAVETPHASLYASDAADVELYRDQLALFRQSAIYGAEALAFIRAIAHPA